MVASSRSMQQYVTAARTQESAVQKAHWRSGTVVPPDPAHTSEIPRSRIPKRTASRSARRILERYIWTQAPPTSVTTFWMMFLAQPPDRWLQLLRKHSPASSEQAGEGNSPVQAGSQAGGALPVPG